MAAEAGAPAPRPFPDSPSLEFDRKQAKSLLAAARAKDPEALRRFVAQHPKFAAMEDPSALAAAVTLSDAQLVIAREYGLPSWRALSERIRASELNEFIRALNDRNVDACRRLLRSSKHVRNHVNKPLLDYGRRPVHAASSSPALMDVLLEFGADINLRSDWANGPFSVMDDCPEDVARQLIARGAKPTAHAAARLGWIDELRAMIDANPAVVHEPGGDGQRPLHFAKTPEIVDLLIDRGADPDARCVDHKSTAAQYALGERPNVARRLLERGATPDIFTAARLGDVELAQRLATEDPSCLAARINAAGYAPVPVGTIYCWVLGFFLSPHEVALKYGHQPVYDLLWRLSPPKVRLLVACARADRASAEDVLRHHPNLVSELAPHEHSLITYSMFYKRADAVRLMLSLGFDPMAVGVDHGTLLHAAGWRGFADVVETILRDHCNRVELEYRDATHGSTPLGWAAHGSVYGNNGKVDDYVAIVRMLVAAGARLDVPANKVGTSMIEQASGRPEVQQMLRDLGAR